MGRQRSRMEGTEKTATSQQGQRVRRKSMRERGILCRTVYGMGKDGLS